MILQRGNNGSNVIELQNLLIKNGFTLKADGDFGFITEGAVKSFQTKNNLQPTGVVDQSLLKLLDPSTKLAQPVKTIIQPTSTQFQIIDKILGKGEYFEEKTNKDTIIIHFTAGSHHPEWVIDSWDQDDSIDVTSKKKTSRIVGTHFVIGGKSTTNGDSTFDGKVYRAVPEENWIHHIGSKAANNKLLNQKSFGIEICNYGPITLNKNGIYYNYVNKPVPKEIVVKLDKPFRGYTYYHDITDAQVLALKELIVYLKNKYPAISLTSPLIDSNGYEVNNNAEKGVPGVYVHTSIRKDKFDWPPLPKLINMLKTICTKQ